jgi:hypothetical protein
VCPVTPPPRPPSAQSSEYEFAEVDEEFLTQLSKIEETYAATQTAGPSCLFSTYQYPSFSSLQMTFIIGAVSPLSRASTARPSDSSLSCMLWQICFFHVYQSFSARFVLATRQTQASIGRLNKLFKKMPVHHSRQLYGKGEETF